MHTSIKMSENYKRYKYTSCLPMASWISCIFATYKGDLPDKILVLRPDFRGITNPTNDL